MKVCLVVGTRPEIIKMSKLASLLASDNAVELKTVYTGQHFSPGMSSVFLEKLGFPNIDYRYAINGETETQQITALLMVLL